MRAALLLAAALAAACGDNLASEPLPPVDAMPPRDYEPWTLIVLPDTQGYTYMYPEVWYAQTRWIADNAARLNTRFIVHVGDITEWNTPGEWDVATRGLADLDGVAPLALVTGNHDYDVTQPRSSRLTQYWPVADLVASPTYGGLFEPDRTDNSYQLFEVNGDPWLVLGLK